MFHVEMRAGMQVVREFNLSEQRLWAEFLAPLMADTAFSVEGHEFIPRQTRLKVYEGEQLRPDQLGLGRGWQNVERTASDVTARVLARAREHSGQGRPEPAPPAAAELVRERLIGRIAAGAISAQEVVAIAAELMPQADAGAQRDLARRAVWELLERDVAQLTPSGR